MIPPKPTIKWNLKKTKNHKLKRKSIRIWSISNLTYINKLRHDDLDLKKYVTVKPHLVVQ